MATKKTIVEPPVKQSTFLYGLGWVMKDITGVEGFVLYRVDNLTGCNQYGLQSTTKETDGKPENHMFDESRLTFTGRIVTLPGQPVKQSPIPPGGLSSPITQSRVK